MNCQLFLGKRTVAFFLIFAVQGIVCAWTLKTNPTTSQNTTSKHRQAAQLLLTLVWYINVKTKDPGGTTKIHNTTNIAMTLPPATQHAEQYNTYYMTSTVVKIFHKWVVSLVVVKPTETRASNRQTTYTRNSNRIKYSSSYTRNKKKAADSFNTNTVANHGQVPTVHNNNYNIKKMHSTQTWKRTT